MSRLSRPFLHPIFAGMRHRYSVLFLLLILSLGVIGQTDHNGVWVWKISNGETAQPSYLLATLHHAHPAFRQTFSRLEPLLAESRFAAPLWPADAVSRNELISLIQRSDAKLLKKEYSRSNYDDLKKLVSERIGDDLISYISWQPLYLRRVLQDAGRKEVRQRFWDEEIAQLARGYAVPLRPLISPEMLARQMNAVPLEDQLELLEWYSHKAVQEDALLDQLAAAYVEGDWDRLATQARNLEGTAAAGRMLDGMALVCATGILEVAYEEGGLLCVPAELLGGPNGLFRRLDQLGVDLEPVNRIPLSQSVQTPDVSLFIAELKGALPAWMLEAAAAVPPREESAPEEEEEVDAGTPILSTYAAEKPLFDRLSDLQSPPTPEYIADPFADLRQPADLDTAFLRQWIAYQPREKDFRVRLPSTPQIISNVFKAEGGTVEVQIYLLNDPVTNLYLLISRSAYPSPLELPDPVRFFDNAVEGSRQKFNGLIMAQRPLSTPIYRGREFVFSLPEAQYLRGRLLLVNNNLYQIVVVGDARTAWEDEAEIFLQSFAFPRANVRTWARIDESGFHARMPIAPLSAKRQIETAGGPIEVDLWSLEDPISRVTYFISSSYYPPEVARAGKEFLDQTIFRTVANLRGELTAEESIKIGRHRGRSIAITAPEKNYRVWFILDGSVLYQVMAGAAGDKVNSSDVDYYFSTFHFN